LELLLLELSLAGKLSAEVPSIGLKNKCGGSRDIPECPPGIRKESLIRKELLADCFSALAEI
jgi:hypothetical protein